MAAFAAGYGHFANLARKAQSCFALRAAEVTVLFCILQSNKKLTDVGFEVVAEIQVFLVFRGALHSVLGKHTEDCPDVSGQTDVIKDNDPRNAGQQGQHNASDQ